MKKIAAPNAARPRAPVQVGGESIRFWPVCFRARARASSRLRGRAALPRRSMLPPWVPRCFFRRFFVVRATP